MKKLSTLVLLFLLGACAVFKEQTDHTISQELPETQSPLSHRFYLIGDAGNAPLDGSTLPLLSLKKQLATAPKNSTVIFLGDNVYQHGIPSKDDEGYALAKHRLQTQIDAVKDFQGHRFFIAGNHDYHSDGVKGLKRQEKLVEKALGKDSFLPENGCGITRVKVSDDVGVIVIDSQWYLENWDKHPTINDDCEIKTRTDFFLEFESLIKKNRDKTTIVAIHHPLMSYGPHGGHFSARQHIFPNNRTFLPVLGTMGNFIREMGGVSAQDIQNKQYTYMVNRLTTIAQESERVIFASGHEHSLQYIEKNNIVQIVSGSGSKSSGVRRSFGSQFAYSALGYVVLDVYENGSTQVKYIKTEKESDETVFQKEVFQARKEIPHITIPSVEGSITKATVYNKEQTKKSNFYKYMLGDHYREAYGTEVAVNMVNLDTLMGGLTPVKRGGGNQSVSLRLVDKNGKQWVMRALKKNAVQFLQINAFQQTYIKEDLKNTRLERLVEDVYTTSHPYAAFIMPTLSKAVGVYHTTPKLYYVPKQDALGVYNYTYGDALYMIEEHVGDTQIDNPNFGTPDDIVSSLDLFKKLQKSSKHQVDEKAYVRARLFDMVLGDWDRHQDQWRWSKFKGKKKHIYKPIPRDRDQVFSNYDGALLKFITRIVPPVRKMQEYTPEHRSIRWHNTNGIAVDKKVLRALTLKEWLVEAQSIRAQLTDAVIDQAFNEFPEEVQGMDLEEVKTVLKYRRDHLAEIAEAYYRILNKSVILTATDKDDLIKITRLPEGKTQIQFSSNNEVYFDKVYDKKLTKEIWVYGLDGKDKFKVNGDAKAGIPLILIGGQNNDSYKIANGKKVTIFDFKSKKNKIEKAKKAKIRLFDNYAINTYDYRKRKETVNQFIPLLGSNKDDGFFFGFTNTLTAKNFRQQPFSHKHRLNAAYFITYNGYDLSYKGEYGNILNNMNLALDVSYTSPNYATNFFGLGNESAIDEEANELSYNRVRVAYLQSAFGVVRHGIRGSEFSAKALFESIRVENSEGRFVNSSAFNAGSDFFDRKQFIGGELKYQFKNYNNPAYPTKGMDLSFTTGWKTNTANSDRNFGYFIPSFSFIHKLSGNERWVLANKTKAHFVFGDNYEFYQGASIGADDGLRGYRFQRFIGNTAFYNSSDIRYNFRKFRSGFAPMNIGFYGGFDVGRVWFELEDSDKWHSSYGGGVWLKMADIITGQVGVFASEEDVRLAFGIGFGI